MANGVQLATAYISLNVNTKDVKGQVESAFKQASSAGRNAGNTIGSEMASSIRNKLSQSSFIQNSLQKSVSGIGQKAAQGFFSEFRSTSERLGALSGLVIGRTIGAGIRGGLAVADFGANLFSRIEAGAAVMARNVGMKIAGAVTGAIKGIGLGAVGAVGYTLMAGFQRLEKIDQAKGKLIALGNSAQDVKSIMESANEAVDATKFSLADAADLAAAAVAAGVKPGKELTKYLTTIADVAAVTGGSLDELGYVMNQVESSNAAYNDSLQSLQTRGLPVYEWLAEQLGTTSQGVKDLASEGKISAQQFQAAIDTHIGGAAKTMGGTVSSSIDNMRTAVARLGANFLSAILGNDSGDLGNAKNAIDAITNKIKELDAWVKANKDGIKQFFTDAKDAAVDVVNAIRDIGGFLRDIPGGVQTVAAAFVAWKSIEGVASLVTALSTISTTLKVGLPASAAIGAAGVSAALAGIAIPAAIAWLLKDDPTFGNKGTIGNGGGLVPPLVGNGPFGIFGPKSAQNGVLPTAPGMINGSTPTVGGIPIPGLGPSGNTPSASAPSGGGLLGGAFATSPSGMPAGGPGRGFPTASNTGSLIGSGFGAPTRGKVTSGLPYSAPANMSGNKAAVYRAMVDAGFPASDFGMLDYIVMHESQYNTTATNPATGDWGIPQFNPAAGNIQRYIPNRSTDAYTQGSAMMRYIKDRYGSIGAAYQFKVAHGWYDEGGWLPPGYTLVQNETGKPELVLNPDQQQQLADNGVDPNTLIHGTSKGAPPGPAQSQQQLVSDSARTEGFVPVAAGNTGVAGTSFVSGLLNLGNEAVSGAIDAGAQLAQMAATAAIAAGTFGGGAAASPAAGPAASAGIQIAANIAKRASAYGFQVAGIGADALIAQLTPFGAPRWLGYDYTQFMPQMNMSDLGSSLVNGIKPPDPQSPESQDAPLTAADVNSMPPAAPPIPPELMLPLRKDGTVSVYDQGGVLRPGDLALNASRRPERILTDKQWDALSKIQPVGQQPLVKIDTIYGMSPEDVANQITSKQQLAMMRYAGRP